MSNQTTNKWNFNSLVMALYYCRRSTSKSKSDIAEKLFDFIADYEESKAGDKDFDFERIYNEGAKKYYGKKANPIPNRFYEVVSAEDFDVEQLEKIISSPDFREEKWLDYFKTDVLIEVIKLIIKVDADYPSHLPLARLYEIAKNNPPEFVLASSLVDVIKFRENTGIEKSEKEFFGLAKRVQRTENNATLFKLFKEALMTEDLEMMKRICEKLTNDIYREKCLVYLANSEKFAKNQVYQALFHKIFSEVNNNKHRESIFTTCLQLEVFAKNPEELLRHLEEFTNEKHLFNVVQFMWQELKLTDEVEKSQTLFTNQRYAKLVREMIKQNKNLTP